MRHLHNLARNQQSVAVEICNWGSLTEKNGKLYSWANIEIPKKKAIELNYKGFKYYEIYTYKEIKALKYWTLLNAMRFGIALAYRKTDMWQLSQKAIDGVAGIYTHNSYISWKTDVSPQPKLIKMAESLADYEKWSISAINFPLPYGASTHTKALVFGNAAAQTSNTVGNLRGFALVAYSFFLGVFTSLVLKKPIFSKETPILVSSLSNIL